MKYMKYVACALFGLLCSATVHAGEVWLKRSNARTRDIEAQIKYLQYHNNAVLAPLPRTNGSLWERFQAIINRYIYSSYVPLSNQPAISTKTLESKK